MPFGSDVDKRIGVQFGSISVKLPAYTNEQWKNDVSYFPCLHYTEDGNMLITTLFLQLQLHRERTGRWPKKIFIAVASKSTNQCYNFVSAVVELVQLALDLGIESASILFSEPGHHIMKIEHMHSRLQGWFSIQKKIASLAAFAASLDGQIENHARFTVRPISWIYDFARRYEGCLNTVTTTVACISTRRLVEITRTNVRLFSEPTPDPSYPPELGLGNKGTNNIVSIQKWFSKPPHDHRHPWVAAPVIDWPRLQQLVKLCRDSPDLDSMVTFMEKNQGRTSAAPELPLFWYKPAIAPAYGPAVRTAVANGRIIASATQEPPQNQPPANQRPGQVVAPPATAPTRGTDQYRAARPILNRQPESSASSSSSTRPTRPPRAQRRARAVDDDASDEDEDFYPAEATTRVASRKRRRSDQDPPPPPPPRRDTAGPSRKFIQVVCDKKIWTCFVRRVAENDTLAYLTTQNPEERGNEWETELDPRYENDLTNEDGWRWITASEAAEYQAKPPLDFPQHVQSGSDDEPASKRSKSN
jgi:hypothetical protein